MLEGRLHAHLTGDHHVLDPDHTRALADRLRHELTALAHHGQTLTGPRKTSSDTDATDLAFDELDELNALFGG